MFAHQTPIPLNEKNPCGCAYSAMQMHQFSVFRFNLYFMRLSVLIDALRRSLFPRAIGLGVRKASIKKFGQPLDPTSCALAEVPTIRTCSSTPVAQNVLVGGSLSVEF
jgi:hypothetical protein